MSSVADREITLTVNANIATAVNAFITELMRPDRLTWLSANGLRLFTVSREALAGPCSACLQFANPITGKQP